jgi:ubiquinone/menaquinone biosynthesis C-methylase UbiE
MERRNVSTLGCDARLTAQRSSYTTPGFAERYDAYRPSPPTALVDLLLQLARTPRPDLVVDLGSGTGLSTTVWADRARRVVGIEPLDEMRRKAEATCTAPQVSFQSGVAQQTGLPAGAADIVTCSQSLHWMEPESTLAEVARILRCGGVFAAYDYDWPPTIHWEVEREFLRCMANVQAVKQQRGIEDHRQQWFKSEHLTRMRSSGHFRYVKEILLHNVESCTAERVVGFARTLGHVAQVLDAGASEEELGLDELRRVAEQRLGVDRAAWYVSYRVRVGVK